jgi:F0F1-type ATP synthase delta subunit
MKISLKTLAVEIVKIADQIPQSDLPLLMNQIATLLEARGERRLLRQLPYVLERVFQDIHHCTHVEVTAPSPLEHSQQEQLINALTQAIDGTLEYAESVDPSLLGGVKLAIHDERFDYSLITALKRASSLLSSSSNSLPSSV